MKKLLAPLLFILAFIPTLAFAQWAPCPPNNGCPAGSFYDTSGAYVGVMTPTNVAGFSGFVPPTQDYPGIMAALKAAIASPMAKNVLFESGIYNLGANYVPLVSGIGYIGAAPTLQYVAGHDGQGNTVVGGTQIQCTNATACMWDGAATLASVLSTVAGQTATTVTGSTSVTVTTGSSYTINTRAYFTSSGGGFYAGIAYYILSINGNVLTLGLPDMVAIAATSNATLTLAQSFPNDSISGVTIQNFEFNNCNTGISIGAQNTGGIQFSKIDNIQVHCGTATARSINVANFNQITVSRVNSNDGDGQYWGSNSPGNAFQWGNSDFFDIINNNNGGTSTPLNQHGILFQAETGSALNEVRGISIQNDNAFISTISQSSVGASNGSPNLPVTDSTKFKVGVPVWISTGGNPNGFTTNTTYFVESSAANVITIGNTKGGAAINSTGSTTTTINTQGFPGLEVVGITTGVVENSSFKNLDIEGNSTSLIVAAHATANFEINQISPSDGHADMLARTFSGIYIDATTQGTTDFDSGSNPVYVGQRGTAYQNLYSSGIYYDSTLSMWCLNLYPGNAQANADMCAVVTPSGGPLLKTISPIADQIKPQDTSKTYTFPDGLSIFNGASGQTYTLPTITNASNATSMLGYPFKVVNGSANNLTVATNGTQTLNNQSGVTSLVLAPNQYGIFIACETTGGSTLFWCAETNGGNQVLAAHESVAGGPPVLTSCGTGSPTIIGSDVAGTITEGTTATGCIATFAVAYASAPYCVVSTRTLLAAFAYTVSNSAITLTNTSNSGDLFDYVCMGL